MDVIKDAEYCFISSPLHPPDGTPQVRPRSFGKAELEILGAKGLFKCTVFDVRPLSDRYREYELAAYFCKESTGERFRIGRITGNELGNGVIHRNFSDLGLKTDKSPGKRLRYKIIITAAQDPGTKSKEKILFEGCFEIPFEIRDDRVIDFKKEAKVENSPNQQSKRNPLFQKVEPFHPPMPNTVWWQINIQPVYDYEYGQQDYCPRRKTNKAVF